MNLEQIARELEQARIEIISAHLDSMDAPEYITNAIDRAHAAINEAKALVLKEMAKS